MRLFSVLTACLLFALTSVQSYAGDYIVEAIVFTNQPDPSSSNELRDDELRDDKLRDTEFWDAADPRIQRAESKLAQRLSLSQIPVEPLELEVLAGAFKKLSNSPEHQVLQAKSWIQPEASYADSLLIDMGDQSLSGTIKVYAPNLLFAELTLRYAPGEMLSLPDPSLPRFYIDEKRKIKLKETHYFDNPRFGVILNVRRAETTDATALATPAT